MAKQLKTMSNPAQLINSNPQLKTILSMFNNDPKTAFYSLAKQKGIDPEDILKYLR